MNRIVLIGRLTRDPELRISKNQTEVASFSLAVDRKYKKDGEPSADFFNCVAFGAHAKFVEKYFKQGLRIGLTGKVQTYTYTNKNGDKVNAFQVVAEELDFADGKNTRVSEQDSLGFLNMDIDMDSLPFN